MQITGIILAGGKSLRMGSDKAMLKIEEKTLLQRAINFCRPFCYEILISSNFSEHEQFGYIVIPDEISNCGPIGGIYSCLKQSNTNWNFVISVDSTFVEQDFVSFLISKTLNFEAVVPIHEKGKEPLIALYHKNSLPAIQQQLESENYKMHFLFEKIDANFVDSQIWVEKFPKLFYNMNYPEDLK